jgi:hypothetical protein
MVISMKHSAIRATWELFIRRGGTYGMALPINQVMNIWTTSGIKNYQPIIITIKIYTGYSRCRKCSPF